MFLRLKRVLVVCISRRIWRCRNKDKPIFAEKLFECPYKEDISKRIRIPWKNNLATKEDVEEWLKELKKRGTDPKNWEEEIKTQKQRRRE